MVPKHILRPFENPDDYCADDLALQDNLVANALLITEEPLAEEIAIVVSLGTSGFLAQVFSSIIVESLGHDTRELRDVGLSDQLERECKFLWFHLGFMVSVFALRPEGPGI